MRAINPRTPGPSPASARTPQGSCWSPPGPTRSGCTAKPRSRCVCGTAPLPASSGRTHRHRLNRGGDRQANSALYLITLSRLRWNPQTQAYAQRRTAEGLSKKEIIRCLKRYLAREVYALLPAPERAAALQQGLLKDLTIYRSINALAESVNGLYKTELIRGPCQGPWKTVEDVELATLTWVHWHNTKRLHSYLRDMPPAEFEAAFYDAQQAAPLGVG